MSSIVSSLFSGGVEGAGKGIAAVVNAIKGRNPEDAAKLQELLSKHEDLLVQTAADIRKAEIQADVSLNETAGQNIRAEAGSSKYASGARPSVIYAGLIVILANYAFLAFVPRTWHWTPVEIPNIVWEIWCVCVTGYVFARSGDKVFGGQGGSAQLPFGIKLDSKGD